MNNQRDPLLTNPIGPKHLPPDLTNCLGYE